MRILPAELAWDQLSTRAERVVSSFDATGLPAAFGPKPKLRIWKHVGLGLHETWSVFLSGDGLAGAVVVTAWDREADAERVYRKWPLPVAEPGAVPRIIHAWQRVSRGLVEEVASTVMNANWGSPSASIGLDGTTYGVELVEERSSRVCSWWGEPHGVEDLARAVGRVRAHLEALMRWRYGDSANTGWAQSSAFRQSWRE